MVSRGETEDQARLRFQIELEFVQCLANPNYLNYLAQRGYLKDPAFVNFLKYLEYWKQPEYAKFLKYPMTLYFLDLIQYPEFRKELANSKCAKFVEDQQLLHWQHYIRKRGKLVPTTQTSTTGSGALNTDNSTITTTTSSAISASANNSTTNVVTTHGLPNMASSTISSSSAATGGPSPSQNFQNSSQTANNQNSFSNNK